MNELTPPLDLVGRVYASAANAGLLKRCTWLRNPPDMPLVHHVGLRAPDDSILENLSRSKETTISYPCTVFVGLKAGETVELERETERQMYFARGGLAKSDTVPAMLTPGEYVVSRESVKRLGAGFFAAINAVKTPAREIATKVQGFARGGLVSPDASTRVATVLRTMPTDIDDLAAPSSRPRRTPRLDWNDAPPPSKTIRVELASGARTVSATVPARDEARLLDLLREAHART